MGFISLAENFLKVEYDLRTKAMHRIAAEQAG
jgi:hypothetical protein